ncbi:MAG: RNA-binding S4 domain-containing protein [Candidatus Moranbacteria bacterium]|nr:RNA-binding S4 domain-containing protein [Candidatus Moranbacteria bacterium]
MRLDLYLKKTRLIKRRTIACEMAKNERIFKNGLPLKPSYEVKIGDEIEIRFGNRIMKISVKDNSDRKPEFEVISELSLGM